MNFFRRFSYAFQAASKYTGIDPRTDEYWVQKLFGQGKLTSSGVPVSEDSALTYSAVWAAVNLISSSIGFLPMIAYERKGEGRDRAQKHPVAKLMHSRPNQYMDSLTFRETLQAHVLLWGNGYAEIERNGGGRPIALWPLLPNRVNPKIVDGKLVYEVSGLTNGVDPVAGQGNTATLPADNVLHIKGLGFDGLKGYSVIRYMAENIGLGLASEKNASTFFSNDSSPSGLLTTDNALKAETKTKLEKNWEEKHKGLDRRYRIAVLHSGLKWQQIGISAKDSQLIESRKYGVQDVARWFNVPPHMLGDLSKSAFTNIEQQGQSYVTYTLGRWLKKWELETSYKLFATHEQDKFFLEFLVDALLRGDNESRSKSYQMALGGPNNPGWMTKNEVRGRENLPLVEGGDELFTPSFGNEQNADDNFSALLTTAWNRIANKEIKALRKINKKPDELNDTAIDAFYEKQKEFALAILNPIFTAIGYKKDVNDGVLGVYDYIAERKADLKEASSLNTVENLLDEWEKTDIGANYESIKSN